MHVNMTSDIETYHRPNDINPEDTYLLSAARRSRS